MRRLCTHIPVLRRTFSSQPPLREAVPLAFTRHDAPGGKEDGPPIILMHGLFGSQRNNRTMSKALAKDLSRPVYTVDLRNHGDSPHAPKHDYDSMSIDVESFISTHSIPRPMLIGHSMGAKVAMTLTLRSPNAYAGLVSVDNAPVDAALKSDFSIYMQAMKEIEDKKVQKQSEADAILQQYETDLSIRQFLLTNLVKGPVATSNNHTSDTPKMAYHFRIPLHVLAKQLPAMADFPFRDPDEARYEGPTLFVRGTKSHYIADESLPLIGRFFPKFELLSLDSGHWVMAERFEEFRAGVVEWVKRCVDERDA